MKETKINWTKFEDENSKIVENLLYGYQEHCSGPHFPIICFHYLMPECTLRYRYDTLNIKSLLIKEDSEMFAVGHVVIWESGN